MSQAVGETLSGGQRQAIAVARALAFSMKVVILDEPTTALGVHESKQVIQLIKEVRSRGLPVILVSHNMPRCLRSPIESRSCVSVGLLGHYHAGHPYDR